MSSERKRVLVTGASSGIGFSIASAFLEQGDSAVIHARTLEQAENAVEQLRGYSGVATPLHCDLVDPASTKQLCHDAIQALGGIDVVIHCAGVLKAGTTVDMSEDDWDLVIATNLKAPFLIAKHTLPDMYKSKSGGRQIFVSSVGAKVSNPTLAAYNASKAGLLGLVRCLAAEVGPHGATANAICPGWVDTPMAAGFLQEVADSANQNFESTLQSALAGNLLDEAVTPNDIARTAIFLAGDGARHITGQAINVCSGSCVW